jgi:hypothetical protein
MRHADHVAPSIRKSWQSLRRQAAVAQTMEFVCLFLISGLCNDTESTALLQKAKEDMNMTISKLQRKERDFQAPSIQYQTYLLSKPSTKLPNETLLP